MLDQIAVFTHLWLFMLSIICNLYMISAMSVVRMPEKKLYESLSTTLSKQKGEVLD